MLKSYKKRSIKNLFFNVIIPCGGFVIIFALIELRNNQFLIFLLVLSDVPEFSIILKYCSGTDL